MSEAMAVSIRPARPADAAVVVAIYNHYVEHTTVSFETEMVGVGTMADRMTDVVARGLPWLVAERDGEVLGYAYATPWKPRQAYRFSVESSVYVAPASCGQGLGRPLYAALIDALRALPVHAVLGGIALPNEVSIALHERLGFSKVGQLREVGFKHERWIDVGYWQLLL